MQGHLAELSGLAKARHWRQCLSLLRQRPGPDVVAFNVVAGACARASRWDLALRLLRQELPRHGLAPSAATYSVLAQAAAGATLWPLALEGLAGVELDAIARGALLGACRRGAHWEGSLHVLGLGAPDALHLRAAAGALAAARRWRHGLALLAEAAAAPDAPTFVSVMHTCGMAARWEAAVALLREMPARGAQPNSIALGAAIGACGRAARWETAVGLLDLATPSGRPLADGVCAGAALVACARGQAWMHCLRAVAEGLGRVGVQAEAHAHGAAAAALVDAGLYRQAAACIEEPGSCLDARTRIDLGTRFVQAQLWQVGLRLITSACHWRGAGVDAACATAAIDAFERHSRWAEALALFRLMEDLAVPNIVTHNVALKACARGALWRHAAALLFQEMPRCRVAPDAMSRAALATALRRGRQSHRALDAAEGARRLHAETSSGDDLCADIAACARQALWARALHMLRSTSEGLSAHALSAAVAACARASEALQSLALLAEQGSGQADAVALRAATLACEERGLWQHCLSLIADSGDGAPAPSTMRGSHSVAHPGAWNATMARNDPLCLTVAARAAAAAGLAPCAVEALLRRAIFGALAAVLDDAPDLFDATVALEVARQGGDDHLAMAHAERALRRRLVEPVEEQLRAEGAWRARGSRARRSLSDHLGLGTALSRQTAEALLLDPCREPAPAPVAPEPGLSERQRLAMARALLHGPSRSHAVVSPARPMAHVLVTCLSHDLRRLREGKRSAAVAVAFEIEALRASG